MSSASRKRCEIAPRSRRPNARRRCSLAVQSATIATELDELTHYDQHRLYKRWSEPNIAMDDFLDLLRAAGFEASRTHYGGTTFNTDADVAEIADAVR